MIKTSALTDLTLREADRAFAQARTMPGAVVEVDEPRPGRFTVTLVWDDAGAVLQRGELDAFDRSPATRGGPRKAPSLGALSERFESNGKPGAIGFDSTGGYSYGSYQIASRTGTLTRFLAFLGADFPAIAAALQAAGGAAGGQAGSEAFQAAWRDLARTDPAFAEAQHAFIGATHYEPFLVKLKGQLGLDVAGCSPAVQDVAWSVAVQHGPGNRVFANALAGRDAATLGDDEIIDAVYAERSRLMRYFPRSSERVRAALASRFAAEHRLALAMLGGDTRRA